ncbi:restriction endonuclease S subunit [Porphyromonas gingivalis AJW4]|uniref:restriction endonuclease subunit S n=1 Tax=Porphyromonas gingivalis TaxID=837 RepID=UPI0006AA0CE6|nr:restriction endonuclease subunit S [Porphyromonas gingivalis]ALA93617.1 restriction endonuclease S subunit [Porphyromonas gingivalis AJW4]
MATNNKILNCPPLRFPEFADEWKQTTLGEIAEVNPTTTKSLPLRFQYIDLESVEKGRIVKNNVLTREDAPSRAQRILNNGDVIFQMVRPYQQNNLYLNLKGNIPVVASTGYAQLRGFQSSLFLYYAVHTPNFLGEVLNRCTGSNYPAINSADLSTISLSLPSLAEQKKIAGFLSLIDERIESCSETIKERKREKAALLNQLFGQKLRFPQFSDEWQQTTLGEVLDYEQPTNYIVRNTEYSSNVSLIPVLTANKSFILGYTYEQDAYNKGKCIILDDFTLDIKFVNFPFKVKSSAIKILVAKDGTNILFIYNCLLFLRLSEQEKDHKRHYISEIQPLIVALPSLSEQNKIADFLSLIDERIEVEEELLKQYEMQKKYLLRQMFI